MRNLFFIVLLTCFFASPAKALDANLGQITTLPASKLLIDAENKPISFIDTGVIRDANGNFARGPHEVTFKLSSSADYPVIIQGQLVSPGTSITETFNLTETSGRLILPIYPGASGVEGSAPFEVELSKINVSACPPLFSENQGKCINVDYKPVTLVCPSDYTFNDSHNNCKRIDTVELRNQCPATHIQFGDSCLRKIETQVTYFCEGNDKVQGDKCIVEKVEPLKSCHGLSTLTEEGLCEQVEDSFTAAKCPSDYKAVFGVLCEKTTVLEPTHSSCSSGYPFKNPYGENKCYQFKPGEPSTDPLTGNLDCGWGYQVTPDGKCGRSIPARAACLEGYTQEGNVCVKKERVSQGNYCGDRLQQSPYCVDAIITKPDLKCSEGFTYRDDIKSCYQEELVPALIGCPETFELSSDGSVCERVESTNLQVSCPAGYTRDHINDLCFKEQVSNAVSFCPEGEGWTKDEHACNYLLTESITTCPAGYHFLNGQCHQVQSKLPDCENGYVMINGRCEKYEVTPIEDCQEGYTLKDGTCRLVSDASPVCSSGSTYNPLTDKCERLDTTPPIISCDNGFSLNNGVCEQIVTEAVISCPEGFILENNSCKKVVDGSAFCTEGTLENGTCVTSETVPQEAGCEDGWDYNSNNQTCSNSFITPYIAECPWNAEEYWGGCRRRERVNIDMCGPGWEDRADHCVRDYEHDYVSVTCPAGSYYPPGSGFGGPRCLKPDGTTELAISYSCGPNGISIGDGQCRSREEKPHEPQSCPSGYYYTGRTYCEGPYYDVDYEETCPFGYGDLGYGCISHQTIPAGAACPEGTPSGDQCIITATKEPNYNCQSGTNLHPSDPSLCYQTLPTEKTGSCPSGYEWGNDLFACEKLNTKQVNKSCPTANPEWVLNNSLCKRTLRQESSWTCDNTSGENLFNERECFSGTPSSGVGICPQDGQNQWGLNGLSCDRTLTKNLTYYCEQGTSELSTAQCYQNNANTSIGSCPSGYTLDTDVGACFRTHTQGVSYGCPSEEGWQMDGTVCKKLHEVPIEVKTCPTNYELLADGITCQRSYEVKALRVCPEKYKLDAEGDKCIKETWIPRF